MGAVFVGGRKARTAGRDRLRLLNALVVTAVRDLHEPTVGQAIHDLRRGATREELAELAADEQGGSDDAVDRIPQTTLRDAGVVETGDGAPHRSTSATTPSSAIRPWGT